MVFSAFCNCYPLLESNHPLLNLNKLPAISDHFEEIANDSRVNFTVKFELVWLKTLKMHT